MLNYHKAITDSCAEEKWYTSKKEMVPYKKTSEKLGFLNGMLKDGMRWHCWNEMPSPFEWTDRRHLPLWALTHLPQSGMPRAQTSPLVWWSVHCDLPPTHVYCISHHMVACVCSRWGWLCTPVPCPEPFPWRLSQIALSPQGRFAGPLQERLKASSFSWKAHMSLYLKSVLEFLVPICAADSLLCFPGAPALAGRPPLSQITYTSGRLWR